MILMVARAARLDRWALRGAARDAAQHGEEVLSVLAGGVDVAADVGWSWVASSLMSRPEILIALHGAFADVAVRSWQPSGPAAAC